VTERQVVSTTRFRRSMGWWARRSPWACLTCAALVHDTDRHAVWHASAQLGRMPPISAGDPEFTETITVHVDSDGWTL